MIQLGQCFSGGEFPICDRTVSIDVDRSSCTYTIEMEDPDLGTSQIKAEVIPESSTFRLSWRCIVTGCGGAEILNEIQEELRTNASYIHQTETLNSGGGGYLVSIKVYDNVGNNYIVPLSPTDPNTALTGSQGTTTAADLYFSFATQTAWAIATDIVIRNYLVDVLGCVPTDFELDVSTFSFGSVRIAFLIKETVNKWIGINKNQAELVYNVDGTGGDLTQTNSGILNFGGTITHTYSTGCGDLTIITNFITPGSPTNQNWNHLAPSAAHIPFSISAGSVTSLNCSIATLTANVVDPCVGILYLWSNGEETPSITVEDVPGDVYTIAVKCPGCPVINESTTL